MSILNIYIYIHYQHCDLLTSNKELDSPGSCYLFLKRCTFCLQISGVAIEDVGVLCFYIYVLEEVIPHEGVVTLRVISGKSCTGFYNSISIQEHRFPEFLNV